MEITRSAPPNATQKEYLMEEIKKRPHLMRRLIGGDITNKSIHLEWTEIANKLNAMPGGAHKTGVQWRKTWQDIKNSNIKKRATIRRSAQATGGGAPINEKWEAMDEGLHELVSDTIVHGLPLAKPSTSFEVEVQPLPPLNKDTPPPLQRDHNYIIKEKGPPRQRIRKRSRLVQSEDATTKFFKMMEEQHEKNVQMQTESTAATHQVADAIKDLTEMIRKSIEHKSSI